ncbi:MAG: ABC transporter ATP-binding protein [Bulleidia sp.]
MSILTLENVCFSYGKKQVLNNINCAFEEGRIYCITGRSGTGKTTLLSLLSALAKPDSGRICYQGTDINTIDTYTYRSHQIGVIFQSYNLLTNFTALENVVLSMEIAGVRNISRKERATDLLKQMGIEEEDINRRVLKLSGGQQQRVAIARAISYDPKIILADEPTGNLDEETQTQIMAIFRSLADQGKCVILVSHSPEVAIACDERIPLKSLSKTK